MLQNRRAQWVFVTLTIVFTLSSFKDAEAAQRRRRFNLKNGNSQSSQSLTGTNKFFNRPPISEQLLIPALTGLSSQALNFQPASSSMGKPQHSSTGPQTGGHPLDAVVDSAASPTAFTRDDQGLPLSAFCNFDCGPRGSSRRVNCYVSHESRQGSRGPAIIRFQVNDESLCHSRKALCQEIVNVGESPDAQRFVCQDLESKEQLRGGDGFTFISRGKGNL